MRLLRLVAALGVLGVIALLLARVAPADWPSSVRDVPRWLGAAPPEVRVVSLATLAAWCCLAWLAYVLVAVAVGAFPRGVLRDAAERVLGAAALGVATGALVAGPAIADGPYDRPAGPARSPAASTAPDTRLRSSPAAPAPRATEPPRTGPPGRPVVVARSDTLWDIATRRLGARATPALTAATWPRWYAANRPLIGPDPDLIQPGQRLVPP